MPSLTRLTSRGAVVNLAFGVAVQGMLLVQGLVVPRLLGPEAIGVFAIAMGGVAIGRGLKQFGITKKLVQERDVDLYTSYRVAFTLEVVLAVTFFVVVTGVAPLLAWIYDRPDLWLLTSILGLTLFTTAFLELPSALPYREMRFVHQNLLRAIGPVASFVVTVPAAFAGWGVWALAAGALAGFLAAAATAMFLSPLRPGFHVDRRLMRRYVTFGWPLWVATMVGVVSGWGAVFVISSVIGVAGVGYFQLAQNWASRAVTVDNILSDTMFPALCSMQSSTDRLRRAFDVTNQLSMLWSATVGFGLVVFGDPVVRLIMGSDWTPAIVLVRANGLAIVLGSIGFNWNVFLEARGETKPQMTVAVLGSAWVIAIALPLAYFWELDGAAVAIVLLGAMTNLVRQRYLRRIFGHFSLVGVVWRQIVGCAVAGSVAAAVQIGTGPPDSILELLAHGLLYVGLCGTSAIVTTRGPMATVLGAVRREKPSTPDDGAAGPVRRHPTHRNLAFPLGVRVDPPSGAVWVTTRDVPAIGRIPLDGSDPRWVDLPPFPHLPRPDGRGGCWATLTRSSAVVHLDADLHPTIIRVERTKELLDGELHEDAFWAVDAHHRRLWVLEDGRPPRPLALPAAAVRPDIIRAVPTGELWVADTHAGSFSRIDPERRVATSEPAPHATRFLLPDEARGGVWFAGSAAPVVTLVRLDGTFAEQLELPATPFGVALTSAGDIVAALKDTDQVAVISPDDATVRTIGLDPAAAPMGVDHHDATVWSTLAAESLVVEIDLAAALAGSQPLAIPRTAAGALRP